MNKIATCKEAVKVFNEKNHRYKEGWYGSIKTYTRWIYSKHSNEAIQLCDRTVGFDPNIGICIVFTEFEAIAIANILLEKDKL